MAARREVQVDVVEEILARETPDAVGGVRDHSPQEELELTEGRDVRLRDGPVRVAVVADIKEDAALEIGVGE